MSRPRPADVRFYFDADLAGVAKVLAELRPDITYPGDPGGLLHSRVRPPCSVTPSTPDDVWIPAVAARGLAHRDPGCTHPVTPAELAAVRNNGAKMVNLASSTAGTKWEQFRIVMHHWPALEALHALPGPFIYRASLSRLAEVDLTTGNVRTK